MPVSATVGDLGHLTAGDEDVLIDWDGIDDTGEDLERRPTRPRPCQPTPTR